MPVYFLVSHMLPIAFSFPSSFRPARDGFYLVLVCLPQPASRLHGPGNPVFGAQRHLQVQDRAWHLAGAQPASPKGRTALPAL